VRIHDHWKDLTRHDEWAVGVVEAPIQRFLEPDFRPVVRWLGGPGKWGYFADPFEIRGWTFCEHWVAASNRGHLCWLDGEGKGIPLSGFPRDKHHSYPYVIEDEGEVYCIPESWESGSVHIYRAVRPPVVWERTATLLPGVAAADPTPFQYEGRWWLAYSDQHAGHMSELCLWHAPRLLGPWSPHAGNPVKSDLGSARPGGTPFWHEGALYRPAQDCRNSYGGGLALNRIVRLTPEAFEEETVRYLAPDAAWPWADGLHTLAAATPGRTLIDAKRYRCIPAEMRRVLGKKLQKLW